MIVVYTDGAARLHAGTRQGAIGVSVQDTRGYETAVASELIELPAICNGRDSTYAEWAAVATGLRMVAGAEQVELRVDCRDIKWRGLDGTRPPGLPADQPYREACAAARHVGSVRIELILRYFNWRADTLATFALGRRSGMPRWMRRHRERLGVVIPDFPITKTRGEFIDFYARRACGCQRCRRREGVSAVELRAS